MLIVLLLEFMIEIVVVLVRLFDLRNFFVLIVMWLKVEFVFNKMLLEVD